MSVSFTVYGKPQPAGSKRAFVKGGRAIVVDDAKGSRPWKQEITATAVEVMWDKALLDGPLLLDLTFWLARPKGHYGTGKNAGTVRESAPAAPTVKPDLLKLARAVEDALTGVVYRDDAQITLETLQKAYTTDKERVVIRVIPVERLLPLPANEAA